MGPTIINTKKAAAAQKGRVVGFPASPVTGISRPVNDNETWVLYNFEAHARKCSYCHNPYEVYRSGAQLCEPGHELARDVAVFLYNKQDGNTYSAQEEEYQRVRVEIPIGYDEARSLLRAMERSLRHRSRQPLLSYDRTYYVAPRRQTRHRSNSVKIEQEPIKKSRRSSVSSAEIVDWPSKHPERRASIDVSRSGVDVSKRGSLYAADIAEQRRMKYHVEVREPSASDLRHFRSSGYYR